MNKATKPFKNNLDYLQAELEWIECRSRSIILEAKARQAGSDCSTRSYNRYNKSEDSESVLYARSIKYRRRSRRMRNRIDERLLATRAQDINLSIDQLCQQHVLSPQDRTILLLAAAPVFSRKFDDLYSELDPHNLSSGLSVEVVCTFLQLDFEERLRLRQTFTRNHALTKEDLITVSLTHRYSTPNDLLAASVELTTMAFQAIIGERCLTDEFLDFSSLEEPKATFEQVVIADEDKNPVLALVDNHSTYLTTRKEWGFDEKITYGRGILMLFHGAPGTGKTMTAHAIANHVGKKILTVDIPQFAGTQNAGQFLPGLFRQAKLQNAVLFFDECESIFAKREYGNVIMTQLLTEIERFEGIAILATNLPQHLDDALERRIILKQKFKEPDRASRKVLWTKHIPSNAKLNADVDFDQLANQYDMNGGYIKNAVLLALAHAIKDAKRPEETEISMRHLRIASEAQIRRLDNRDQGLTYPKATLSDVVLSPKNAEIMKDIIEASRNLRTVLDTWRIGEHLSHGKGVCALLFGPPGTGKTLCAQAIAGELNRPILTVNTASVLSKWVGETEGNLEKVFTEAKARNAVLFLDEVDSLLRARGQGNASRHDDASVNTILKLIEENEGLVIMATNHEHNLDQALKRRITFCLEFKRPSIKNRALIWEKLLANSPGIAGEIDYMELARVYDIGGGEIKTAIFKAAFRAAARNRKISQADLEKACHEQLEYSPLKDINSTLCHASVS
ncbi:MAG: ATP-binding protein [Myxococcota bacterium]|nr:ATP-binding protein [Myxococcota bacterium]